MSNDIFGGLMKGIGAFIPKDDPNIKLFQSQSEISEYQNQERELYAKIGQKVLPNIKDQEEYKDLITELVFTQKKLKEAQDGLQAAQTIKSEQEEKEQEMLKIRTCPNCDTLNPEGIKFCQECGSRMNQATSIKCMNCGAEHPIGTRFCGECGRQL